MSQNSTARPLSKFNLVLALLWLVDVVVTGVGYWVLTSSNATQADFYTSQSADYVRYFSAQSGSNLGATLIGVGLTGFIITLAAMVVARSISKNVALAAPAVDNGPDFDFDDDTDFDTHLPRIGNVGRDAVCHRNVDTEALGTHHSFPRSLE